MSESRRDQLFNYRVEFRASEEPKFGEVLQAERQRYLNGLVASIMGAADVLESGVTRENGEMVPLNEYKRRRIREHISANIRARASIIKYI